MCVCLEMVTENVRMRWRARVCVWTGTARVCSCSQVGAGWGQADPKGPPSTQELRASGARIG